MAQCPTSGTVSTNCTKSGNLNITSGTLNVNSGVVVTVTGTLTVRSGGTINGTGATFNVGGLAETYGSTNTLNGGTFNTGSFSTGSGGDVLFDGITVNISPDGNVALTGSSITIDNSTFTGVANWSTNASSFSMDGTDITASGSIQFEDATIANGTFIAGTSFSTTNGTNTIDNATITAGTTASLKNTTFTDTDLDVQGLLSIQSGSVSFDNGNINSGIGNAGANDGDALTMNGGGALTLTGNTQMNVRGSVTNNEWYVNNSDVVVTGDFDNAGAEILEVSNNGTFVVQGDFNNTGSGNVSADDGAVVTVDGDYDNSGGGSTDVSGGTLVVGGGYSGDTPTGDAGDCDGGAGGCCGAGCDALPVELLSFEAKNENNLVQLDWETATELNNDFFSLERSFDGKSFHVFANINGSGTVNEISSYHLVDNLIWQSANVNKVYYRLSQTDFDGTHKKLKIVMVQVLLKESKVSIYPNPVTEGKGLHIMGVTSHAGWRVYSLAGELLAQESFKEDLNISVDFLIKGSYLLLVNDQGVVSTLRFTVR